MVDVASTPWKDDQAISTTEVNNKQMNEQMTKLLEEDEVSKEWEWTSHSKRLMFPTNRWARHLNGLMFPTICYEAVQTADQGLVNSKQFIYFFGERGHIYKQIKAVQQN